MSQRQWEITTAKAWHLTPAEWDALDPEARAEMMVLEETVSMMAEYERKHAPGTNSAPDISGSENG